MLPGLCCIANRHIGARERRQLIPHVRFQVPFQGPESQLKSGFACAGLLCSKSICWLLKINAVVIFCLFARVGLCCGFCDFAVSFLVPPDGGTARRSHFLGPCLGSFFEVFCIRVAEAQSFGFNETLWPMATGRATREALLSEAGFEKVFRTQNWVRRSKLFCR